ASVCNTMRDFVDQCDYVLMIYTAYDPMHDFCSKILSKLGVTTSWFDRLIEADIGKRLQTNTKSVFMESPGSIALEVHDVTTIVATVSRAVPDAFIMIGN
ncbi:PLP-dependent transferase, partial [Escherichia coli]|uniref:PLP-dependent transferase n=1 Tax=Escherichia coli TaxID=562 RepID=UPI00158FFBEB